MTPSPNVPAFTAPKTTIDTSILDVSNLYFYAWLLSFAEFVQATYGIMLQPSFQQIAGIPTGSPFNVYAFYVYAPTLASNFQGGWMYIGQSMLSIFQSRLDDLATVVLTALSYPLPAPKKIAFAAPPAVPPTIANPLGQAYEPAGAAPGTLHYTDRSGSALPFGAVYQNTDASVAPVGRYTKHAQSFGPFGTMTWWEPTFQAA